jgi:hypothetical protein
VVVFSPKGFTWHPAHAPIVQSAQLTQLGSAETRVIQCVQGIRGGEWSLPAECIQQRWRPFTVLDRFVEQYHADAMLDFVADEAGKKGTSEDRLHKNLRNALHGRKITSRICRSIAHYYNDVWNPMFAALPPVDVRNSKTGKLEKFSQNKSPIRFRNAASWDCLVDSEGGRHRNARPDEISIRGAFGENYIVSQQCKENGYYMRCQTMVNIPVIKPVAASAAAASAAAFASVVPARGLPPSPYEESSDSDDA